MPTYRQHIVAASLSPRCSRAWVVWAERATYAPNPTKLIEWRMKSSGEWVATCYCRFSPWLD